MANERARIEVTKDTSLSDFKKGITEALKDLPDDGSVVSVQALPTRIEDEGKVIPLDIFYDVPDEPEEKPNLFQRMRHRAG